MQDLSVVQNFGEVSAEDDAVLEYFLSTNAVEQIESGRKLLVLGRKGSGKTALVRHFTETNPREHGSPLSLKSYPWTSHQALIDRGASLNEAYVASWKLLISIRIASMVCQIGRNIHTDAISALEKFLLRNFGSIDPEAKVILHRGKLDVEGLTIGPTVGGVGIATVNFSRRDDRGTLGIELDALANSILIDVSDAISELRLKRLYLHFDELDQGLDQLDETKSRMLIGLILAAREVSSSRKLRANISPIVYLRTDIWDQLSFSDKNKITQGASIPLMWDSGSLKDLVNKRLMAQIKKDVKWEDIEDGSKMRGSQSKWAHIISRTLLRPRDVIQFLNIALQKAKSRKPSEVIFTNDDINGSRDAYSLYLKNELDDEIDPHWSEWSQALQACTNAETLTFHKVDFEKSYRGTKSKTNKVSAEDALEFLFRFSVVGYETRSGGGGSAWVFKYSENQATWNRSAPRYKVHQGLKEFAGLKEERNSSS